MNKKIITLLAILIIALVGGMVYLFLSLQQQKQENQDMQELAALDKQEMENEYERFTLQYSEKEASFQNDKPNQDEGQ